MARDGDGNDWLTRIQKVTEQLQSAEKAHRDAAAALSETLYRAHEVGIAWSDIAKAAGLRGPDHARMKAQRGTPAEKLAPSVRWRLEQGRRPQQRDTAPGVTVTEAAARLGVARPTVYAWIKKGKLAATTDEAGRTRVLLDDSQ